MRRLKKRSPRFSNSSIKRNTTWALKILKSAKPRSSKSLSRLPLISLKSRIRRPLKIKEMTLLKVMSTSQLRSWRNKSKRNLSVIEEMSSANTLLSSSGRELASINDHSRRWCSRSSFPLYFCWLVSQFLRSSLCSSQILVNSPQISTVVITLNESLLPKMLWTLHLMLS